MHYFFLIMEEVGKVLAATIKMDTPMFNSRMEMINPDLVWGSFCSSRCAAPRTPPLLSGCALGGGADQASSFLLSSGGDQLVGGAPSAGAVAQDGSSSCCRIRVIGSLARHA